MRESNDRRSKGEGSVLKLKHSRFWYASYYQNRKQKRFSTGETVKARALVELRKMMGQSERGLLTPGEAKKLTYDNVRTALLQDYEARAHKSLMHFDDGSTSIKHLKALDDFFEWKPGQPGISVASITADTSRAFHKKRLEDGVGTATINRSLALLRRMLNIAHADGKLDRVPKVHFMAEPPARQGVLPEDKYLSLMKRLPAHVRPLISFLYYSAVRSGEAKQLKWRQLDWNSGHHGAFHLEAKQAKSKEGRWIPLHSETAMLIKQIPEDKRRPDWAVFESCLVNLRKDWESGCTKAGLGTLERVKSEKGNSFTKYRGLQLHDLRRTAITAMVNGGVREKTAMAISGHKTRDVFDRYNIVAKQDMLDAMEAVTRFRKASNDINVGVEEFNQLRDESDKAKESLHRRYSRMPRRLGRDKMQLALKSIGANLKNAYE